MMKDSLAVLAEETRAVAVDLKSHIETMRAAGHTKVPVDLGVLEAMIGTIDRLVSIGARRNGGAR